MADRFRDVLKVLMEAGDGNGGVRWTAAKLAEAAKLTPRTITAYRTGESYPDKERLDRLSHALFPSKHLQQSSAFFDLRRAWALEREKKKAEKARLGRATEKSYSLIDVWRHVIATRADEVIVPISGASLTSRYGGFGEREIIFHNTGRRFFLPYPSALKEAAEKSRIHYDFHTDNGEYLGEELGCFSAAFPEGFLRAALEKHAQVYAQHIIADFESSRAAKPYNKLKFGVYRMSEFITPGKDESVSAEIELYITDYFTNWVISRVFEDLKRLNLARFREFQTYPRFIHGIEEWHLPIMATSLGLNCFIVSRPTGELPRLAFTRLARSSSNAIQHEKLHVTVNEGMNLEECSPETGEPLMERFWRRMVAEELGAGISDQAHFEALDIFVDKTVGEVGIFGVITTDLPISQLDELREKTARDRVREFRGGLESVVCDDAALIKFVLGQPRSINSFTSYTPHLIDIMLTREITTALSA